MNSSFSWASFSPRFWYRPTEAKMTMSVSGVLRTMLTYQVPNTRITGTGETRMPARTVPQMRAPMAE
ncbi:hypothetical protein W823_16870 [Williamsia sp. D3]|nr:hypothetical protein W823_16870 [Williamsia sp. D3]